MNFFLIFIFLIAYHYFLFPIYLFIYSRLSDKNDKIGNEYPSVSLIIAAYNEEKVIENKILNSLELDYPLSQLKIIVVSDGSKDKTPEIVKQFKDKGVVNLFDPVRRGKTAALNRGMIEANGDIVVFSDANSMYHPLVIKNLIRNFTNPDIGGVCGRKSIIKNTKREASSGDSFYWDIESKIKIWQSKIGSITTGDGEIFAIRKDLYQKIPEDIINDDTAITFNIIRAGYRVIYEPEAISYEEASINLIDDFNVKTRMVYGGYQTLSSYRSMIFPPINFFSIQFISHKVLRWIMPLLLVGLFVTNLTVLNTQYKFFFILQVIFYLSAIFGYMLRNSKNRLFYFPMYYCIMNIAALKGLYYFLSKQNNVSIWKKAKR